MNENKFSIQDIRHNYFKPTTFNNFHLKNNFSSSKKVQ